MNTTRISRKILHVTNDSSRTALYRFFDVNGRLLYIGITEQVGRRWDAHMRLKSWWPEVHRQTVEWHDSRAAAAAAEVAAITEERPRHNARHSTQLPENVVLGSAWRCPACKWETTDLADQLDHMETEARRIAGNNLPSLRAEYLMRQVVWARNALERTAISLNRAHAALAGTIREPIAQPKRPTARVMPGVDADKLLSDLVNVLGHERVRLSSLPELLRQLDPDCPPYHKIKGTHIRAILRSRGIRVTNTDNIPRLDPSDLTRQAS